MIIIFTDTTLPPPTTTTALEYCLKSVDYVFIWLQYHWFILSYIVRILMNLTKILMYSVLLLKLLTLYLNFFSEIVICILYAFVSHRHSQGMYNNALMNPSNFKNTKFCYKWFAPLLALCLFPAHLMLTLTTLLLVSFSYLMAIFQERKVYSTRDNIKNREWEVKHKIVLQLSPA